MVSYRPFTSVFTDKHSSNSKRKDQLTAVWCRNIVLVYIVFCFFLVCVCVGGEGGSESVVRPKHIRSSGLLSPKIGMEIIILYFRWLLFSFLSSLGVDFHWYRLDQGGLWSHKPGQTRVTQSDKAGNNIVDPRTAANGNYHFALFMTSDITAVTIN